MQPIIDAHHHLWDLKRLRYDWLNEVPAINRSYFISDYQEAISGLNVVKSVFAQANATSECSRDETLWILSLADSPGTPIEGVVAWAPIEDPEVEAYLEQLPRHPKLKGVRRLIQSEEDSYFCARPAFVNGVRLLEKFSLSFDVCIIHHQLPAVIQLVREAPEVSFVLDHIGKPDIKGGVTEPWATHIRELASEDNVVCKLSGLVTEADMETWTAQDLKPYIDHVIDAFGFDRLMFGSDWPVCTLASDYGRWLGAVQEATADASDEEKYHLFYGTAERFYRL